MQCRPVAPIPALPGSRPTAASILLFQPSGGRRLELSCASCHHEDPRREQFAHHDKIPCRACHGMPDTGSFEDIPKIRRQFLPLAPSANSRRFTDEWFVEKWFRKNCGLLLKRDCTPVEKGDVIVWLLTLQ
jgi:hypothetical protein